MAAPSYRDFAPSPLPSDDSDDGSDNTTTVRVLVIVAVLAMLLLHILGSLRRLSSHDLLHTIVAGIYTLSYPLVSYIIGLMKASDWYHVHFAIWAVFLLLLLGNTDSRQLEEHLREAPLQGVLDGVRHAEDIRVPQ